MKSVKNFMIFFILFIFLNIFSFAGTKLIIHTPFGHEPVDDTYDIDNTIWDQDQQEESVQTWIYSGGLFLKGQTWNFSEKNNYMVDHAVLCMDIDDQNIYIGTEDGFYESGDYGSSWDNTPYLSGKIIFNLSIEDKPDVWLACTDAGVWKSSNGYSWSNTKSGCQSHCIILKSDDYFIATTIGIFKSTDGGDTWVDKTSSWTSSKNTNAIYFIGNTLFACTPAGLRKSTDLGENWDPIMNNTASWNIFSIFVDGSNIYLGTEKNGIHYSTDNGINWFEKNSCNFYRSCENTEYTSCLNCSTFHQVSYYFPINSLLKYSVSGNDYLFAATENGLNVIRLPITSFDWEAKDIRANSVIENETNIKMFYTNGNDLFVVCNGDNLLNNPAIIRDSPPNHYDPDPTLPHHWAVYNCSEYAFHFFEGGHTGIGSNNANGGMGGPQSHRYINPNENAKNWDYIKATTTGDNNDLINGSWEKVMLRGWNHVGIKSYISPYPDPFVAESIRVISKWGPTGPLVEHYLNDHPWYNESNLIKYFKSKKEVSGASILDEQANDPSWANNQFVGRQIVTSGTTTISLSQFPNGIDFFVAPMYNHIIDLKSGFHAEYGSTFHAFVKNEFYGGYQMPWESTITQRISANEDKDIPNDDNKNSNKNNCYLKLSLSPNPSDISISVLTQINGFEGKTPINLQFYSFDGKIVKQLTIKNGVKSEVNLSGLAQGSYIVSAQTDITDKLGDAQSLTTSEIFIIEK